MLVPDRRRASATARRGDAWRCCARAHEDVGGDVVSAGGTGTYDVNTWATEIQAGSYALMDTAYAQARPARSARRCRCSATVISVRPGSARWPTCGLKALGMDHGNPAIDGATVWFCSDEHVTFVARRRPPGARSATGCGCCPAHVDPTVAYHERMHLVDDDDASSTPGPSTSAAGELDRLRVLRKRSCALIRRQRWLAKKLQASLSDPAHLRAHDASSAAERRPTCSEAAATPHRRARSAARGRAEAGPESVDSSPSSSMNSFARGRRSRRGAIHRPSSPSTSTRAPAPGARSSGASGREAEPRTRRPGAAGRQRRSSRSGTEDADSSAAPPRRPASKALTHRLERDQPVMATPGATRTRGSTRRVRPQPRSTSVRIGFVHGMPCTDVVSARVRSVARCTITLRRRWSIGPRHGDVDDVGLIVEQSPDLRRTAVGRDGVRPPAPDTPRAPVAHR